MSWPGRLALTVFLTLLVLVVSGSVLFQAGVFVAPHYTHLAEQRLSARLGRPVQIGDLALGWQDGHPDIGLTDVVVMQKNGVPLIRLGAVKVGIDPFSLISGRVRPTNITVSGLSLTVVRGDDGNLGVPGLPFQMSGTGHGSIANGLAQLSRLPRMRVVNTSVQWRDDSRQYPGDSVHFSAVRLSLKAGRKHRQVRVSARLPARLGGRIALGISLAGPADKPLEWSGGGWLRLGGARVQPWLAHQLRQGVSISGGLDSLKVTGRWRSGGLRRLQAKARVGPIRAHERGNKSELLIRPVDMQLNWHPDAQGWVARAPAVKLKTSSGAAALGPLRILHKKAPPGKTTGGVYTAGLKTFPLSALQGMAGLFRGHLPRLLAGRSPRGRLRSLNVTYRPDGQKGPHLKARGRLAAVELAPAGGWPGVRGLNAAFDADSRSAHLTFDMHGGALLAPHRFDKPVPVKILKGQVKWQKAGSGWKLNTRVARWTAAGTQGSGRMRLSQAAHADSPRIDLKGRFSVADVTRTLPYLPHSLSKSVRHWLVSSLESGGISDGRLSLSGRWGASSLGGGGNAHFTAGLNFSGVKMNYASDWPELSQLSGHLGLKGHSLKVKVSKARIGGVTIASADARVADLRRPVLRVTGRAPSTAQAMLAFIRRTPLKSQYQKVLSSLHAQGPTGVHFNMNLPFSDLHQIRVSGKVDLQGVMMRYAGMREPMTHTEGRLHFSNASVSARDIRGRWRGLPLHLRLAPVEMQGGQGESITATARLKLPEDAPAFQGMVSSALLKRFKGTADLRLALVAPPNHPVRTIHLTGSFKEMAINLPAPFTKKAGRSRNLRVRLNLPASSGRAYTVRLGFGSSVSGVLALTRRDDSVGLARGEVRFGGARASLPPGRGMVIRGHVNKVNLDAWRSALSPKSPTAGTSSLRKLDIETGEFIASGQHFKQLHLHAVWSSTGLHIHVQGPQAQGRVVWAPNPGSDKRARVRANFARLHLTSPLGGAANKPATASTDPAHFPGFNLHCGDCSIAKLDLGTVNVLVEPSPKGLEIRRLQAQSKEFGLSATGRWVRQQGLSEALLKLDAKTTDLDELLRVAGFAPTMNARQARIKARLAWLPAAKGLSLARLNGHISLHLKDGNVRGVKTRGAGKLLGLLSFDALPRRLLLLDFHDLTKKGLAFDTIDGDFRLDSGVARTHNLTMKAPALKVSMRGNVGLASHTYDENVHINPDFSSGVTLAGFLLGGPIAGAALFVTQYFFDTPLDKLTELTYHLGGTWKKPVFKLK